MATLRKRARETQNREGTALTGNGTGGSTDYQQARDQRIKENKERMQKLGLLDLSQKLNSKVGPPKRAQRNPAEKKTQNPSPVSEPSRRSSRLKTLTPVSYVEIREKKKRASSNVEISIPEGSQPEKYTEEHYKLLGDCKTSWTLFVDGYGEDRKRIYDPVEGKSCHQCRQKTLGRRTHCSKCNLVQGQFCGDCLYMRYGENVIEVNQNPNWICPVCRGICNCSRCRQAKGWMPTGSVYKKVTRLGFKSVAHYLIQTRLLQANSEGSGAESLVLVDSLLPTTESVSQPSHSESNDTDRRSQPEDCENDEMEEEEKEEEEKEEGQSSGSSGSMHVDVNGAHNKDDTSVEINGDDS